MRELRTVAVWSALLGAGCGEGVIEFPSEATEQALQAFVAGRGYAASDAWLAQDAAPRDSLISINPHGRVRVWLNDAALLAIEGAGDQIQDAHYDTDSAAVKELFDDQDQRIGTAVMWKLDGQTGSWAFYCEGDALACGVNTGWVDPYFVESGSSPCAACHGGFILSVIPPLDAG